MTEIDDRSRELLEAPIPCCLTTLRPAGDPHSIMVWCGVDGHRVTLNGEDSRVWLNNLRSDPRVAILVVNPKNELHYVSVRGVVSEVAEDVGFDHIDDLGRIYEGTEEYRWARPEDETRFKVTVEPLAVRLHHVAPPADE